MNTIYTYTGTPLSKFPPGSEPTKQDLCYRVQVLTDVVQALIEHIAEKEKIQIGVMQVVTASGPNFVLYMQASDYCDICQAPLPMLREGWPSHACGENGKYICQDCACKK